MTFAGQPVSFRADASLQLGSGHVMRCLTLADELRTQGAVCQFICREQPGDLIKEITGRGYSVNPIEALGQKKIDLESSSSSDDEYERRDAAQTRAALLRVRPTLMIVDHYSLGQTWETRIALEGVPVVAIDDLANRSHDCEILIDQNLGRLECDYRGLVPAQCQILVGPQFALLRSEFSRWRPYSLQRRPVARLHKLFVSMGGVDQLDVTSRIIAALQRAPISLDCRITVVMGPESPWVAHVRKEAAQLRWCTEVLEGTAHIAEIMADSDLAIGAAGGTAWERCCLGLPTLIVAVVENQRLGASALVRANAAYDLGGSAELGRSIPTALEALGHPDRLGAMSLAASRLVDGLGADRVRQRLEGLLRDTHAR